ncbi:beta-lactamase/transpeptidase-like protein [Rhexocercosporidium sp. MPI-PUGE-AT-0058]|nr:beta-lactamase/transpeptidase-like protein [Rhexocercosporidium sp. MPI-PUGE-AT-0058]
MTSNMAGDESEFFDRLEALIRSQSEDANSIEQIATDLGAPVVSIGVLDSGEITTKVIGTTQPDGNSESTESQKKFNKDTLFQACSISKPITALAVIKLCQEGTLDLDTPISQYLSAESLSWISTPKTLPLVSQITLRLLLSHTAGLSCHGFRGYNKEPVPSLEQMLRGDPPANNEPITLALFPGQKFFYSGGGFQVVQLILETMLQKPFHDIMQELVLGPLEMTRSTYAFIPSTEKNYAPAHLSGKVRAEPDFYLMAESAAAGLWTTPSDLLKAIHAIQRSLQLGDILEAEWTKKMLAEVENNGMALGWMTKKGTGILAHIGNNEPGYACYVAGFADFEPLGAKDGIEVPKYCGVAVMTCSALGGPLRRRIVHAISYLKGWPVLYTQPALPFMDREASIDERASEWYGKWGKGKWILAADENGNGFSLKCGSFPAVALVTAAIPAFVYEEGKSVDLVADGLEIMVRLGWKDGKRIVEVWQDNEAEILELA